MEILKSLGLPSKQQSSSTICLEKDGILSFDHKANAEIFKDFYSNLASDLVKKLPNPQNKFGTGTVSSGVVAGGGGRGQSPPSDNFLGALKSKRGAKIRNSNVKYYTKYVKSSPSTNSKILKHLMARVQTAFY